MDLRFGMVPMGLRFVVVPISLVVCMCVFFFKVALVDVGLCRWWLVGVVAVGGRCCGSGGCAIIVVDGDYKEEIIYYFNV